MDSKCSSSLTRIERRRIQASTPLRWPLQLFRDVSQLRDQVLPSRVGRRLVRVDSDRLAGKGDAGRVGERQVALVGERLRRDDLELAGGGSAWKCKASDLRSAAPSLDIALSRGLPAGRVAAFFPFGQGREDDFVRWAWRRGVYVHLARAEPPAVGRGHCEAKPKQSMPAPPAYEMRLLRLRSQ